MKLLLGLVLISLFILIMPEASASFSSPPIQQVFDGTTWVNYRLFEDASNVYFEASTASFVFDKNTCTVSMRDGLLTEPTSMVLSHTLQESVATVENWSPANANNESCSITKTEQDGIATITASKGDFVLKYDIDFSNSIEWTYQYTNNDNTKSNHKYGFSFICDGAVCSSISSEQQQIPENTILDKNDVSETLTMSNGVVFDTKDSVHGFLDKVKVENDRLVVEFTKAKGKLNVGQKLTVDPVFFFNNMNALRVTPETNFDFEISDDWSATGWFATNATGVTDLILSKSLGFTSQGWNIYQKLADSHIVFRINTDTPQANSVETTLTYNDGLWHHFAATKGIAANRNAMNLYIDGVLISTGAAQVMTGSMLTNNSTGVGVAGAGSINSVWGGSLDEIFIFNSELSAAQVTSLYAGTNTTNPILHLRFSNNLDDSAGLNNTVTLSNGTATYRLVPPNTLATQSTTPTGIDALTLNWAVPSVVVPAPIIGYRIETSPDGLTWAVLINNTADTDTSYLHGGLSPAETVYYRVAAWNEDGLGNYSSTFFGTTGIITSWAALCQSQNLQMQNAYSLIVIILVVIAAVTVIALIKFDEADNASLALKLVVIFITMGFLLGVVVLVLGNSVQDCSNLPGWIS